MTRCCLDVPCGSTKPSLCLQGAQTAAWSHVTAVHKWRPCFLLQCDKSPPQHTVLRQRQAFYYYLTSSWGLTGSTEVVLAGGSLSAAVGQKLGLEPSQRLAGS